VAGREKIVYSRTLAEPRSARTKIERAFDPDGVRKLKANVANDIAVAGPELAAQAIQAGLVDEFQMRVCPVVISGGKRYFPSGMRLDLELVEERRFRNGEIFLRYAIRGQSK
jgi:dihydrofolate reductase